MSKYVHKEEDKEEGKDEEEKSVVQAASKNKNTSSNLDVIQEKIITVDKINSNTEENESSPPAAAMLPSSGINNRRSNSVIKKGETWMQKLQNRKSIVELIHGPDVFQRKSITVYGQVFHIDNNLRWRIKHGQRLSLFFAFVSVTLNIFKDRNEIISMVVMLAALPVLIGIFMIYYKNVSYVIIRKLLKESNVIIILSMSIAHVIINGYKPDAGRPFIFDILLFLFINLFVFMDSFKVKSRLFVIIIGILFLIILITNIWRITMGNGGMDSKGEFIILLKYQWDGMPYIMYKRPIQRSIFIQTLLFSVSGLYTLFRDTELELMIFCKGNIYRDTGTTSKHKADEEYSKNKKEEDISVIVQKE